MPPKYDIGGVMGCPTLPPLDSPMNLGLLPPNWVRRLGDGSANAPVTGGGDSSNDMSTLLPVPTLAFWLFISSVLTLPPPERNKYYRCNRQ
jgi:hypothetical protein